MDSSGRPIRFLDLVRERIRLRHLSYTTEKSYIGWIRRFIVFHGKKHPQEMEEEHIVAFLSDLAVQRNCSPATQNQALNALVFLFRHVLNRNIGEFKGIHSPLRSSSYKMIQSLTAQKMAQLMSSMH